MADSLGSSCLDQKFHPTVEEFMPTDPNFYPKKKFSCNIQPPSLEDVQNMLASRMKIDENQAKICGNVKKDYKQKAHKAKETLHGKPFLGAENLEGNELEKHNDNVDAQFAQIQGIFLTPDTEAFIPREKLDTTSLNPFVVSKFREKRSIPKDSTWGTIPEHLMSFIIYYFDVDDWPRVAILNRHWNNRIMWLKMSRPMPTCNPFGSLFMEDSLIGLPFLRDREVDSKQELSLAADPPLPPAYMPLTIAGTLGRKRQKDGTSKDQRSRPQPKRNRGEDRSGAETHESSPGYAKSSACEKVYDQKVLEMPRNSQPVLSDEKKHQSIASDPMVDAAIDPDLEDFKANDYPLSMEVVD